MEYFQTLTALLFPVCGGGPDITENIGNITTALGREATLKCVVTELSDYKVSLCLSQPPRLPPKSCNWETVTTYRALEVLKVGPRGENLGNVRREESEESERCVSDCEMKGARAEPRLVSFERK